MPRIGLIVNDGKPLAVQTADTIQQRLEVAGHEVVRASSSGGMVGFANPDQHLRLLGYSACVPEGFNSSMALAIVLGVTEPFSQQPARRPVGSPILTINTGHLGFLAEAYLGDLDRALEVVLTEVDDRGALNLVVSVMRGDPAPLGGAVAQRNGAAPRRSPACAISRSPSAAMPRWTSLLMA